MDVLTGVLALVGEELANLVADLTIWDLDVVLLLAVVGQEVEEAVLGDVELYPTTSAYALALHTLQYVHLQAGIPGDGRSGHPCCGWTGTDPPTSCR